MGNNLSATAPSQIFSVDTYLGDVTEYQFDRSLGSTRFMKVARVKHQEGLAVVKVFAVRDPNLSLDAYKKQVEAIREKLKHASNCLPFQTIMLTDKAALLFRQYVKHNLYDRISTRPFYNSMERRWVTFQLLCALNQMAKLQICHGDIKSENIMITSWNWLLLTDFASYKPIQVPDDNPADFNYFFDTSRRRICNIAPERFMDSNTEASESTTDTLLPSMDIFSAGCIIAELFTDGTSPFDFAQLLAFREGKYYPSSCLSKIDDRHVKSLVEHMIQKDPSKRYTAEQYLSKWKGKAFPVEFYSHLKKYLGRFCEPPLLSADQTINLLHTDLPAMIRDLPEWETSESLITVAAITLSCLRKLKYCSGKLRSIEIIVELAKHLTSHDILERIIPYLMEMVRDKMPRVRASAFQALAKCAALVESVPRSEVNIFSEYIFPGSSQLSQDEAVFVRQTYASHIALLADTASKFLNASSFVEGNLEMLEKENFSPSFDVQLQTIHDTMQETVQILFSDPDSMVRHCLLRNSVMKLCTFFGRSKCNDVILSHMITFLNDKQDWQLRSAFFDCLVWVSTYVGWQSTVLLKPLLQQGLNDSEEYVICKTLDTLTSLTAFGLFSKQLCLELLHEAIPLLQHPCTWIRFNTIGFIAECSKNFSVVDIHCRILPKLKNYLVTPIIQPTSKSGLLAVTKAAVKRRLYEIILTSPHIGDLLNHLQARKIQRSSNSQVDDLYLSKSDSSISTTFQKLQSHGMDDEEEEKILNLCDFIQRQSRHRATVAGITAVGVEEIISKISQFGQIDINLLNNSGNTTRRHAELAKVNPDNNPKPMKKTPTRNKNQEEFIQSVINEEWKSMFGSGDLAPNPSSDKKKNESKSRNLADAPISMSQLEGVPAPQIKQSKVKTPTVQLKYTNCKLSLRKLVHHQRDLYEADVRRRDFEHNQNNAVSSSEVWRPRGVLVAHMLEHRGAINRIAVSPMSEHFATVSSDRTMKLWDCDLLSGKGVINQSKSTWAKSEQNLLCCTFCNDDKAVCAGAKGDVHYIDLETMTDVFPANHNAGSRVMDITSFTQTPVISYITAHGDIVIWDLRESKEVCTLRHNLHDGLMTCLVVDPKQHWLCVATVSGKHVCWDLRFRLPVTQVSHHSAAGVRRMAIHPLRTSSIISSVNGNNEVNIWDLETSSCSTSLWASTVPVMSSRQRSQDSVNGLLVTRQSNDINIITAGTDSVIRLWDIRDPVNSKVLSDRPQQSGGGVVYEVRRVEGMDIIQEHGAKKKGATGPPTESGQELRGGTIETCHHDVITDLAAFKVSQNLLVSASTAGVVKLWK